MNEDNADNAREMQAVLLPIGHQRTENHQRIFHECDHLTGGITLEKEFASRFECAELEILVAPVADHLVEFSFDVLLFGR